MTIATIVNIALPWLHWLFFLVIKLAWGSIRWVAWLTSPAWLLAAIVGTVLGLFGGSADAGWFSWGPDPKIEAANQALQRAAQIATEAANIQAQQHGQILEAVTALSNERTNLAQQLTHLGQLAATNSAWAAALHTAGPVLIAVAVLALGCAACWMVTRASDHDSHLASVLVEEIVGNGPGVLLADSGLRRLSDNGPYDHDHEPDLPAIEHTSPADNHTTGDFPF